MSYLKKILGCSAAFVAAFGAFIIAPIHGSEPVKKTLTVGLQSGYPPFEYVDEKGNIVGFDVDLANIIAQKLGMKLVVQDMDFDGEILSLKQGKIDLIMSGMNITSAREKEIAMVPYHGEETKSLSLIFWGKIPSQVHSLQDIENLPNGAVAVEAGSIGENYLNQFPKLKVKAFQGALGPLMDVKYGKSTADLVEPDIAAYLKAKYPQIEVLNVPLPPNQQIKGFGIGINKGNADLQKKVDGVVAELKANGDLKKLEAKWFKKTNEEGPCSPANP